MGPFADFEERTVGPPLSVKGEKWSAKRSESRDVWASSDLFEFSKTEQWSNGDSRIRLAWDVCTLWRDISKKADRKSSV